MPTKRAELAARAQQFAVTTLLLPLMWLNAFKENHFQPLEREAWQCKNIAERTYHEHSTQKLAQFS